MCVRNCPNVDRSPRAIPVLPPLPLSRKASVTIYPHCDTSLYNRTGWVRFKCVFRIVLTLTDLLVLPPGDPPPPPYTYTYLVAVASTLG